MKSWRTYSDRLHQVYDAIGTPLRGKDPTWEFDTRGLKNFRTAPGYQPELELSKAFVQRNNEIYQNYFSFAEATSLQHVSTLENVAEYARQTTYRCPIPREPKLGALRVLASMADSICGINRVIEETRPSDSELRVQSKLFKCFCQSNFELLPPSFVNRLISTVDSLVKKYREVRYYEQNKGALITELTTRHRISLDEIDAITFHAFSVNVLCLDKWLCDGGNSAYHGVDSPINIYSVFNQDIVHHEELHNYLDGSEIRCEYVVRRLKRFFEALRATVKPEDMGAVLTHIFDSVGPRLKAKDIVNALHQEFVTCSVPSFSTRSERVSDNLIRGVRGTFTSLDFVSNWSTWKWEIDELQNVMAMIAEFCGTSSAAANFRELSEDVRRTAMSCARALNEGLFAAHMLGLEAMNEVRALSVVLLPTQYKIIPAYLVERYDQETVSLLKVICRLLHEAQPSPDWWTLTFDCVRCLPNGMRESAAEFLMPLIKDLLGDNWIPKVDDLNDRMRKAIAKCQGTAPEILPEVKK